MLGKAGAVETEISENPRRHWESAKSKMWVVSTGSDEDEEA